MVKLSPEVQALRANLKSLPDFKIKIDGFEWQVHSHIICVKSNFFDKICNGAFKESEEKCVTLHDDCPWIIARMIQWFYLDCITIADNAERKHDGLEIEDFMRQGCGQPGFEELQAIVNQRTAWMTSMLLCEVADKYAIPLLASEGMSHLKDTLLDHPKVITDMLDFLSRSALLNNKSFGQELLEHVFPLVTSAQKLHTKIEETCGFHDGFMRLTRRVLAGLLNTFLAENEMLSQSILTAKEGLAEIDGRVKLHKNGLLKRKFEEIDTALEEALAKVPSRNADNDADDNADAET